MNDLQIRVTKPDNNVVTVGLAEAIRIGIPADVQGMYASHFEEMLEGHNPLLKTQVNGHVFEFLYPDRPLRQDTLEGLGYRSNEDWFSGNRAEPLRRKRLVLTSVTESDGSVTTTHTAVDC